MSEPVRWRCRLVRQGSVARVQPVGCPGVAGGTVAGLGAFRWIGCGRRKCCRLPGRGHAALSLLARSDVRAVRWRCWLAADVLCGTVARAFVLMRCLVGVAKMIFRQNARMLIFEKLRFE